MGKRVIRLTEADIENIVKKVIKEQSSNYTVNCPSGGILKVKGNSLYWANDEESKEYKIWEVGTKPTYKIEGNSIVSTGLLNIQYQIFNENPNSRRSTMRGMQGYGILPVQRSWETALLDNNIYFYSLDENGAIHGDCSTVIKVDKKTLNDKGRLSTLLALGSNGDLPKMSKDRTITFGDTYVKVKRNVNLLAVRSLGPALRVATPDVPQVIKLALNLQDVFKVDSIEFEKPEAEAKINEFAQQIQNGIDKYGDLFRRQMNAKLYRNPILGYASIDGDPEGDVPQGSGYESCSGQKRKDYNKCLSEARAKKVADILNKKFSDDNMINFKYKGMGETDQLSDPKGKKWPKYKPNETGENRKIILDLGEFKLRA